MEEKKNIVLILGNGFDMNLSRKTSYKDFWNTDYCPKNYPAPLISHLNSCWNNNIEEVKWYDLENELLEYYNSNISRPVWKDILPIEELNFLRNYSHSDYACRRYDNKTDIINSLILKGRIIISNQLSQSLEIPYLEDYKLSIRDRDFKALELIKTGLCNYIKEVDAAEVNLNSVARSTITAIELSLQDAGNHVSVYSFNYTSLPNDSEDILYPQYIHGRCKHNKIIIGTKDSKIFNRDYDFLQKSFDPHYKTPPIVSDMLHADEVIIFGHSLGINDSQYFKPFFTQQTDIKNSKRIRITIFTKDEKSEIEIKRSLQLMTDYNLSLLYSLNDFEIILTDNVHRKKKIFEDFLNRHISKKQYIFSLLRNL